MLNSQPKKPYQWISSLYFFQSMPFVVVTLIAALMYQQYGMDNCHNALLISLLALPWVVKPVFAPLLEKVLTRKKLTVLAQALVSLLFLMLAVTVEHRYFLFLSIIGFACMALASSVHDIVSDGVYLLNLDEQKQKRYVPLRTVFYQLGRLALKGGLLILAGQLAVYYPVNSWQVFFFCLFLVSALLALYHLAIIPESENKGQRQENGYFSIVNTLVQNRTSYPALFFIFLYNASEAQMQKMIPLFLLDEGGLNLELAGVGSIYGLAGSFSLLIGVYISGFLMTQFPVKRCLKILTVVLMLGHALFMLITSSDSRLSLIVTGVVFSQLAAGLANGAFMGYLLSMAGKSSYPMSAYTLYTSVMALGYVVFGASSGFIQHYLDYSHFFLYIFIVNVFLVFLTFRMAGKHDN
ncbi:MULTISPECIES: MFS transporter [unclassified Legionella]|uniref:MFS transporter n=1 Tax=unclassified Legionella TaxID=2622702 RepID=UPI00105554B1|nr:MULTISPECIES: MFS transporter [unclassified Legionella]MDI9819166.1 MFS transporter [Legionella sp. PL877]